jgi:hypothetical protein
MNKIIFTLLIIFLVFGVTQAYANSITEKPDYENIIKKSDYIFIGFPIGKGEAKKTSNVSIVTMWEIMPYVVLKGSQSKKQISLRTSGGEINGEVLPGVNLKTDKMYIFFLKRKENPFIWETVNAEELSIRPVKVIEFTIIDTVIKFKDSELVKALDNYINNNDLSKYKIKEVNNIGWKQ